VRHPRIVNGILLAAVAAAWALLLKDREIAGWVLWLVALGGGGLLAFLWFREDRDEQSATTTREQDDKRLVTEYLNGALAYGRQFREALGSWGQVKHGHIVPLTFSERRPVLGTEVDWFREWAQVEDALNAIDEYLVILAGGGDQLTVIASGRDAWAARGSGRVRTLGQVCEKAAMRYRLRLIQGE